MGKIVEVNLNQGIKKMVENSALAFTSVDTDGNPHNIAAGYVKVVSKNQLLISDNYLEETLENIKNNSFVSLAVWSRNWEENCVGYEFRGEAEYFEEGEWVERVKQIPVNETEPCKGAILVTINKMKVLD